MPLTKDQKLGKRFGQVLIASIAIVEVVSIMLLSVTIGLLGDIPHGAGLFSVIAMIVLFGVPVVIRRQGVRKRIADFLHHKTSFETGVRFSIALLLILTAVSDVLGFEAIIGAFLAGLIVRHTMLHTELKQKLEGLGFGFFIPLFFVLVGARIDIRALFGSVENLNTLLLVIGAGLISNIIGVYIVARLLRFTNRMGVALGMFHATLLSLTIAAAEIASREGLITEGQFAIFVLLAIVTTLIGATVGRMLLKIRIVAQGQVTPEDQLL